MKQMKAFQHTACVFFSAAAMLSLVACSDYDNGYTSKEIEYQQHFSNAFPNISSEQDWNAAKQIVADIDLSGITSEEAQVFIYSDSPLSGGQLAAHYEVSDTKTFSLDLPKTHTQAYVIIKDKEGETLISRYYAITDGVLYVNKSLSRASGPCNTTVGRTVALSDNYTFARYGDYSSAESQACKFGFDVYYLQDVFVENADALKLKDILKIVGNGGYFQEGVNNRSIYKNKFKKDIIYKMEADGPVSISNQFGGTAYTSQFGYYYYREGSTPEQTLQNKLNARRYVVMDKAEPHNNITVDDATIPDGMWLPNQLIGAYYGGWPQSLLGHTPTGDELLQGKKYNLVYYGDNYDGTPSYTFPKDVCIGFFVRTLATSYPMTEDAYAEAEKNGQNIVYSDSELNKYYGKFYYDNGQNTGMGDWKAVTYTLNLNTVVVEHNVRKEYSSSCVVAGFEDGTDDDMNDILFMVEGVSSKENIIETPEVKGQTWIIGCEDLGSSISYDFNDIVFSITHVAGQETATITPLAAGGTRPAYLYYQDQKLTNREFHQLWGTNRPFNITINADSRGEQGTPVTFRVPKDYTVSFDENGMSMGGIEIRVLDYKNDEVHSTIDVLSAPDKGVAPKMILMYDTGWAWPLEEINITKCYPLFEEYVKNPQLIDWVKTVNYDYTTSHGTQVEDTSWNPFNEENGGNAGNNDQQGSNDDQQGGNDNQQGGNDNQQGGNDNTGNGNDEQQGNSGNDNTPSGNSYEGTALQSLYNGDTYVIPASAVQNLTASSTITITYLGCEGNGNYFQLCSYVPAGSESWQWKGIFVNGGNQYSPWQSPGNILTPTTQTFTLTSDGMAAAKQYGICFKVWVGSLLGIAIHP